MGNAFDCAYGTFLLFDLFQKVLIYFRVEIIHCGILVLKLSQLQLCLTLKLSQLKL
jgi:hypothetical protein